MTNIAVRKRLGREGKTRHLHMSTAAFREGGWSQVLIRWSGEARRHLETAITMNPVTGGLSVYCKPKDAEWVQRAIHEMEVRHLTYNEMRRQAAKEEESK